MVQQVKIHDGSFGLNGVRIPLNQFKQLTGFKNEYETLNGQQYPTIRVLPMDWRWQYYCDNCKTIHIHGRGLGPRVTHCFNKFGEYVLKPCEGVTLIDNGFSGWYKSKPDYMS